MASGFQRLESSDRGDAVGVEGRGVGGFAFALELQVDRGDEDFVEDRFSRVVSTRGLRPPAGLAQAGALEPGNVFADLERLVVPRDGPGVLSGFSCSPDRLEQALGKAPRHPGETKPSTVGLELVEAFDGGTGSLRGTRQLGSPSNLFARLAAVVFLNTRFGEESDLNVCSIEIKNLCKPIARRFVASFAVENGDFLTGVWRFRVRMFP